MAFILNVTFFVTVTFESIKCIHAEQNYCLHIFQR